MMLIVSGVGCAQPASRIALSSHDPAVKIRAMKKITDERRNDHQTLGALVDELSNDDGAVRMYAIRTLEHLTGKTFDYKFYEDVDQRRPAVAAWKNWLAESGKKSPATQATASRTGG